MTVADLIELLQKCSPTQTVVTDLHSEYSEVGTVATMVGYDNGGYVSRLYPPVDPQKGRGYVYIGSGTYLPSTMTRITKETR